MENIPLLSEKKRHEICNHAIELKNDIEFRFMELGGLLHEIRENNYFEAGWTSWEEYSMELKISQATISKLIRIYEVFVLKYEFSPAKIAEAGGWSVVAELLPDVIETTEKAQVEGWLSEAKALPRTDLRRAITERRKGIDMEDCGHEDTYTIKICRRCGARWKLEDKNEHKKH